MTNKISDEMTANFLYAAILSLRQNVVPALSTPESRIHADLVSRVLYMLQSRFARRGTDIQQLIAEEQSILKGIATLLPDLDTGAKTVTPIDDDFSAIETLERQLYEEEAVLASSIPQLIDMAQGSAVSKPAAINSLRNIVATQKEFFAAQDPDILKGSYVCYQGGRMDEERPVVRSALLGAEVNETTLTQHLQKQFPGARVEKISVMAGGFSKSTIFFTLIKANGESDSLVMRKDLPVDYVSSVVIEFPLLQQVHKAGFPVAEPLWLENDPKPFGGRFMVSRRVSGSTDISRWASDKAAVDGFARQLAKVMVDLHALNLDRLGFPAEKTGKSSGDLMRAEIERWKGTFLSQRQSIFPLQEISLAWLQANIPATAFSRPASLVHGDIGFHNLMIDNGHVTALLDWEFSHLGDPIEDLLYAKPFIEKVMDWETFKSYYREYGGASCTAEDEFFYTVWSKARNPVSCVQSSEVFTKSLPHDVRFAATGYIFGPYLQLEAAQMIVDSLRA